MLLCSSSRHWGSVFEEPVEAAGEVALEAAGCFGTDPSARTHHWKDIRERSHSAIESQTKSTDANLTNAPDGTAHTLTVRECPPSDEGWSVGGIATACHRDRSAVWEDDDRGGLSQHLQLPLIAKDEVNEHRVGVVGGYDAQTATVRSLLTVEVGL
jgi:hypothetical protein